MKKFIVVFLINLVVLLNVCFANSYDNDPDYYFVMNVQRIKTYLYLPSVDVQVYSPPNYQIAGLFVNVGGIDYDANHVSKLHIIIKYNFYTKDAFEFRNGNWRKMAQDPKGSTPVSVDKVMANALFIAAYGMKFYE